MSKLVDSRKLASRRAELGERGLLDTMLDIARSHHVLLDEVLSGCRTKKVVVARHAMFAHLRGLGFSSPEVGALLMSEHSTVLAAARPLRVVA